MDMKKKNIVDSPYFEFLRYCLREDEAEPKGIANINWDRLYDFGKNKQYLVFYIMGFNDFPLQTIAPIGNKF